VGLILDCMPPYQVLVLRNVRNTGTAKLPAQNFPCAKRIGLRHQNFITRREKSCTSLLPRYATIARDFNAVKSGAKLDA